MMVYKLTVQQVENTCTFDLSWGQHQRLRVQMPFPEALLRDYQAWGRAYLGYYRSELRGRPGLMGQAGKLQVNWHGQLGQAEAKLLSEFHRWLRSEPLYEIRQVLGQALQTVPEHQPVDVFLTCTPLALARLPWETWELAKDGSDRLRFARAPLNIRPQSPSRPRFRQGRARVLAILGDTSGLNIDDDLAMLRQTLKRSVDIVAVVWREGSPIPELKRQISDRLADPLGWDILFFAGHSNESGLVGGEIAIAPNVTLSTRDLRPALEQAIIHGLQFALFNSCSGLDIADALIDIGLSQVAIMREPIHDQVALIFLQAFLAAIAAGQDSHDALISACRHLRSQQQLTYPSAYLVPSLFRHPNSHPFQLEAQGWRRWLPRRRQAVALTAVAVLSLLPPVQSRLLAGRLLTQAIYRDFTGQVGSAEAPPVALIQIDTAATRQDPRLSDPQPLNREYIADLVTRLRQRQAQVIGLDIWLDRQQGEADATLRQEIQATVAEKGTWFVFGSVWDGGQEVGLNPDQPVADLTWSWQGYTNVLPWYVPLPWQSGSCYRSCGFAYSLALLDQYRRVAPAPAPHPDLQRRADLRREVLDYIPELSQATQLQQLYREKPSLLTAIASRFGQNWFKPIMDFSLPPHQVYVGIPASELLAPSSTVPFDGTEQIAVIGAWGYGEAGTGLDSDNYPLPPAIAYWRSQPGADPLPLFPGLEAVAYSTHHLVRHHWVIPLPDLWLVGLAAFLAQGLVLGLSGRFWGGFWGRYWGLLVLGGITLGLGLVSLQIFVATGLLVPWLLPSAVAWIYLVPPIWKHRSLPHD